MTARSWKTEATNDKKTAEKTLAELKVSLTKLRVSFDEIKLAISSKLDPLGYSIDFADPKSAIRNLKIKNPTMAGNR